MSGYIYLASPYTHPDPAVRQQRYEAAVKAAGFALYEGFVVYSPVAHSHPIYQACDLPDTWDFWKHPSLTMLEKAAAMYILDIPGWKESTGIRAEVDRAIDLSIPVRLWKYEDPDGIRELTHDELDEMGILPFNPCSFVNEDDPESTLLSMLAVMQGDGGHRTEQVGLKRSIAEVLDKWYRRKD